MGKGIYATFVQDRPFYVGFQLKYNEILIAYLLKRKEAGVGRKESVPSFIALLANAGVGVFPLEGMQEFSFAHPLMGGITRC